MVVQGNFYFELAGFDTDILVTSAGDLMRNKSEFANYCCLTYQKFYSGRYWL